MKKSPPPSEMNTIISWLLEEIDKKILMLSYPSRWRYDILRTLDCFQYDGVNYDPRIQDALDILIKKRRKDGKWPVQ